MKKSGNQILRFLLFISGVWIYLRYRDNKRRKKEFEADQRRQREFERQVLFDYFKLKLNLILSANNTFNNYLSNNSGYFTHHQMSTWISEQTALYNEIKDKDYKFINLTIEEVNSIKTFIEFFTNVVNIRNDFNKKFVEDELKTTRKYFDNIEGRKLDIQQRRAIVTDEDNNIVIAGAGSGKTTTIVGKVNYIIDRYNIPPEEILLISFTNKSATTLANRINIKGIEAKTFHKFGKDTIVEAEGKQPNIFDEAQFKPLLAKFFTELISVDRFLQKVTDYFTNFLKPVKSQFEFENQGDYIQYIKDQNFRCYKQKKITKEGKETFKMEVVKSIEECKIANFLLFNGIDYEYELSYEKDNVSEEYRHKPDFTITQNKKKIYLEHFGISRNGTVPSWFSSDGVRTASEKYRDGMEWKRNTHKINGTTLVESYSYEMSEGILFDNLTKNLQKAGIVLKPKSPEEIWKIISEVATDEVRSFITLFGTFITLIKSNNFSINDVIIKNKQVSDKFQKERNDLFIEILKPVLERYEKHLIDRNEIDFSDMINKATKHIESGMHKRKFSYIIIDEFQDISIGRYQLIKSIKNSNPTCKLFCVGDDWQSIYRFSGSDIALFRDFEKYFGFSVKSKIETTYRFNSPLIKLSSDFILKNPNQVKKELKGISNSTITDFKIQYSFSDNQDDTEAVQIIFEELLTNSEKVNNKSNFILGRYGFDIERLKSMNGLSIIVKEIVNKSPEMFREYAYKEHQYKNLKDNEKIIVKFNKTVGEKSLTIEAEYLTVHRAKGLEADNVIILNCNSGKHGFPSELSDDKALNLLLSEADQFENGEERRLFYVAMTRAKKRVFFVADSLYKSKFIAELEVESGQSLNKKCPECKTADLVLRKTGIASSGSKYRFYGCSNYLYGCDYTDMVFENKVKETNGSYNGKAFRNN